MVRRLPASSVEEPNASKASVHARSPPICTSVSSTEHPGLSTSLSDLSTAPPVTDANERRRRSFSTETQREPAIDGHAVASRGRRVPLCAPASPREPASPASSSIVWRRSTFGPCVGPFRRALARTQQAPVNQTTRHGSRPRARAFPRWRDVACDQPSIGRDRGDATGRARRRGGVHAGRLGRTVRTFTPPG